MDPTNDERDAGQASSLGRRRLFRLGAAAGATAIGGAALLSSGAAGAAEADPTAAPDGRTSSIDPAAPAAAPTPMAAIPIIPGAEVVTLDFSVATAVSFRPDSALVYIGAGLVTNAVVGWIDFPLSLPVGAQILRFDVFGNTASSLSQSWFLARQNLPAGTGPSIVSSVSIPAGIGPRQGGVTLVSPATVAPGDSFYVELASASGGQYARGVVVQYRPPSGAYVAIQPVRVHDTRQTGGKITNGQVRTITVANKLGGGTVVPAGAKAVAFNLVAFEQTAAGWLAVAPADQPTGVAPTPKLGWSGANQSVADGSITKVNSNRQIKVQCSGGSTHFVIEILGYFV